MIIYIELEISSKSQETPKRRSFTLQVWERHFLPTRQPTGSNSRRFSLRHHHGHMPSLRTWSHQDTQRGWCVTQCRVQAWHVQGPGFNLQHQEKKRKNTQLHGVREAKASCLFIYLFITFCAWIEPRVSYMLSKHYHWAIILSYYFKL